MTDAQRTVATICPKTSSTTESVMLLWPKSDKIENKLVSIHSRGIKNG
jgi:hypothetical protein